MSEVLFEDEPEDAWHPGDTIREMLDNLSRRADLLGERRRVDDDELELVLLDDLELRIARIRRRDHNFTVAQRRRLRWLVEDTAYVRTEL
jgi:hypothetical protein